MHLSTHYPQIVAAAKSFSEEALLDLCISVQQVPAPTDDEEQRALWVAEYLRTRNFPEVFQDDLHNVYARIPGRTSKPVLMISAHTDTVFPIETDLTVTVDKARKRAFGPAIGDNSVGVAALLALAQALRPLEPPPVDIWFVANSGEEGLGDLRGMRAAVDRLQEKIGACIVIEGMGLGRIVHQGLGSRRYKVSVSAPGGHSWSDFGSPSAIHILTQIAAELATMQLPTSPRTTYNVGRIWGGTSVNTIAQSAALELDLRSENGEGLQSMIDQTQRIVARHQKATKKRDVTIAIETIGDRPTGEIPVDHPLVIAATESLAMAGLGAPRTLRMSSTDANIPLSRGIPAVCVGITEGGDAHRLGEWIRSAPLPQGMQHLMLLSWWTTMWLGGEVGE